MLNLERAVAELFGVGTRVANQEARSEQQSNQNGLESVTSDRAD